MSKLDLLCKQFNKNCNSDIVQMGIKEFDVEKIPFSSPRANYATYGGIPRGRLVEFYGAEGGGKTTSALDICANAQKLFEKEEPDNPKKILFVDAENTLDSRWATKLGVDCDKMLIVKPEAQSAEELFQFVLDAIDTGEIGLVVFDSLGVLVSQQAYDKDISERTYGGISMPLTTFSKKATMLCQKTNCTVLAINQIRDNLSSMYGGTVTCGGRAWRHDCSLRIEFKRGDFFDEKNNKVNQSCENPAGNLIQFSIIKSKVFANNRKTGFMSLNYLKGIDYVSDTLDVCMRLGYVVQAGAWYSVIDPDTGEQLEKLQGRPAVLDYLAKNSELYDRYIVAISKYIQESD